MAVFATTYRVHAQTSDPLAAQVVGAAFMAPMFLGGAIVGTMTDRLDRYRSVSTSLGVLIPLAGLMGLAVANDHAPVWVSYVFVFCIGTGNLIDMTSRRSIAFDLVGASLIANAAAMETLALHAGNTLGSLSGGLVIDLVGTAWVYVVVAGLYVIAGAAFRRGARTAGAALRAPSSLGTSARQDLRAAFGLLLTNGLLRQLLVITVLMNFFYYAFTPLIPAFADELGVGPLATGAMASAMGFGSVTGAFLLSRLRCQRGGLLHIGGSCGAMVMLIAFANMTWYPAALLTLFVAGVFGSGFGATQSALVVSLVDESQRGRALGVLSMAIGALPFGMFSLGLVARRTDPQLALTLSVTSGLCILLGWQALRPQLRSLRT